MHKRKVHLVVGARPNYMKIAPLYHEFLKNPDLYEVGLIHTGQHYDEKMSHLFFVELGMPVPDAFLEVGSGTHGQQTAKIIERYEYYILNNHRPDLVVVAGDVNSTIACALVAKKQHIHVAHLEAGLRSFDENMPEEINRVLTDRISDILLTPSIDGNHNLNLEGIDPNRVFFVGNIMIDSLIQHKEKASTSSILASIGLSCIEPYALVTLHRPSNVDTHEGLDNILEILEALSKRIKTVFPIHPRTRTNLFSYGFAERLSGISNLITTDPVGYLDFLRLEMMARLVLTDSGGIQEETTFLGVPCLTMRENTERPITVSEGTNILVGLDKNHVVDHIDKVLTGCQKSGRIPERWDGKTAKRVFDVIDNWFNAKC